jgi:hypothetical protein
MVTCTCLHKQHTLLNSHVVCERESASMLIFAYVSLHPLHRPRRPPVHAFKPCHAAFGAKYARRGKGTSIRALAIAPTAITPTAAIATTTRLSITVTVTVTVSPGGARGGSRRGAHELAEMVPYRLPHPVGGHVKEPGAPFHAPVVVVGAVEKVGYSLRSGGAGRVDGGEDL